MTTLLAAACIFGAYLTALTDSPQVAPAVKHRHTSVRLPVVVEPPRHGHRQPWDRLAACESGGDWHIDTGMFDGGLQFLPATWDAYGGRHYAPTADRATKAEQITVAERLQAAQGWAAWPSCSLTAGLR